MKQSRKCLNVIRTILFKRSGSALMNNLLSMPTSSADENARLEIGESILHKQYQMPFDSKFFPSLEIRTSASRRWFEEILDLNCSWSWIENDISTVGMNKNVISRVKWIDSRDSYDQVFLHVLTYHRILTRPELWNKQKVENLMLKRYRLGVLNSLILLLKNLSGLSENV